MTATENFFVECVRAGICGEKIAVLPVELDYKQLYRLCRAHSVSVIVLEALENVKSSIPSKPFLKAIERASQRLVMLSVQSDHDTNVLLSAFEENRFKYMPLKGYHLKKLYPKTTMRYTSDCDVLIDISQLKEIRALVKRLGLLTKRRDEHHDIVYHPDTKTIFELHKTIFVGPLEKYFGIKDKGFERASVRSGYKYFYEMDRERFYASVLAHSAYHFAQGGGIGIRHLTDIYLYRRAYKLNEEYLNEELKKCGLLNFKNELEKTAALLFDKKEADEFTTKLAEHVIHSSLLTNENLKTASAVAAQTEDGADAINPRKRAIWRKIFPIKDHMVFSYPILNKCIWLLPIFYIVRWARILFTRPKSIIKLKKMGNIKEDELNYMKEIRERLNINHL